VEEILHCTRQVRGSKSTLRHASLRPRHFFSAPERKCRRQYLKLEHGRFLATSAFRNRRKLLTPILKFPAELYRPFHNLTVVQSKLLVTPHPSNVPIKFHSTSRSWGDLLLHKDSSIKDPGVGYSPRYSGTKRSVRRHLVRQRDGYQLRQLRSTLHFLCFSSMNRYNTFHLNKTVPSQIPPNSSFINIPNKYFMSLLSVTQHNSNQATRKKK
jgi:hypothetical protein